MIVVRIRGGLGNQLFTYAYGYSLAREENQTLSLDVSDYYNGYFRKYVLDKFNIEKTDMINYKYIDTKLGRLIMRFLLKIRFEFFEEKDFSSYQKNVIIKAKDSYFYGYWQNEEYFLKYRDDLIRQFTPKLVSLGAEAIVDEVKSCNSVAVHIRRGDYIDNSWNISWNYYQEAIEKIEQDIESPIFYFFSDDINWVKSRFESKDNYIYVDKKSNLDDIEEFWCMSNCNNFIIANSSFSWWAAWLNNNPQKKVVAPEIGIWKGGFYPKSWEKISLD